MTSEAPRPTLSVWMRLIIGLYTAALLSYIGIGAFSRMMADDFCTAYIGSTMNPFVAARHWYDTWSGLYTNFFIKSAIAPLEPTIHPFLTALFIVGIFAVLWRVLRDVLQWHSITHAGWIAFLLSGLLTFGLVDGAVSRQPILWAGALIPYSLALIPLVGALGLAFRLIFAPPVSRAAQIAMSVLMTVLVFLISGFSEVYAVYQGTIWGMALILGTFALTEQRRTRLWGVSLLTIIVTAISLAIILAAPGNEIRRAAQEQTRLITSPMDLMLAVFDFSLSIFILEPYGIVHFFLAFFGALGIWLSAVPKDAALLPAPRRLGRAFFISFLVAFALVMVAVAAPMYGAGVVTSRTLMPVRFTQLILFALWGYWAAVGLSRGSTLRWLHHRMSYRLVKGAVLAAFMIIPTIVLVRHLSLLGDFATYARQWDVRHAQILEARAQGESSVTIDQLDYNLEEYLTLDSLAKASTPEDAQWVYDCAANYYGVDLQLSEPTEIVQPDQES